MSRVLIVTEPMEYGVLSYLERLLDGLDRSRWEPALACSPRRMSLQAHRLVATLRGRGIRVRHLGFHRGIGVGDAAAAAGLVDEMRTFRPDIVHLHSTKAGLIGRVAAALLGIPALYTPHGTSWKYTGRRIGWLQLRFERALRRATATLLSVCPEEARAFVDEVGFDPAGIRIVRNGVSLPDDRRLGETRRRARAELRMDRDETWLLFVGRLTHEKGADVLLAALERGVRASGLLVVGDGPERGALEARASHASIPVRFCGYREDVSRFLAAADVFVQPSRSEGLPFAVLEAMAHGLPVVGSRVGGVAEAVADCGMLVPADCPAALAESIRAVTQHADRRRALGDAARARVARRFAASAMLSQIHDAYDAAAHARAWRNGVAPVAACRES